MICSLCCKKRCSHSSFCRVEDEKDDAPKRGFEKSATRSSHHFKRFKENDEEDDLDYKEDEDEFKEEEDEIKNMLRAELNDMDY